MNNGTASQPPADASFIDGLDPRTRLLTALTGVVGVIALSNLWLLAASTVAAGALVWFSGIPVDRIRGRLLHLEGFLLLLLVLLPFTTPGTPLFSLGPLQASRAGVLLAVSILLTVNACVLVLLALLSSMDATRLAHTLARVGVPWKLAHLFLFTARFIGLFRAEAARLRDAMRARVFVARSNLHTWRSLGNLVGMLLVRSLERADAVDEAMRCRAFSGHFPIAAAPPRGRGDALFAGLMLLVVASLVGVDWWL